MTSLLGSRSQVLRALCVVGLGVLAGCQDRATSSFSFYEERIDPILDVGCQRQTTGCHVDDGRGFALGNLDLRSYDSLMRRRDVLPAFGPYPVGLLLLKAGNPAQIQVRTIDPPDPDQRDVHRVSITTDIRHAAGSGAISQGSRNYSVLKQWIDGGYARNGVPRGEPRASEGSCSHTLISRPYIDTQSEPRDIDSYQRFAREVAPVMKERCAGSSCHGSGIADLYLTCGSTEAELRWNYEVALRYLDEVAASSELLRRPLAERAGGVFHEGGDIFDDVRNADYRKLLGWIEATVSKTPELLQFGEADEGLRYFGNRVQPILVRKGCMFLNCHSPAMFHDLRLRGGSQGFFSEIATRKNYEMSRALLALDSEDPGQSRLIAKNLCPPQAGGHGIQHRGGALFEDFDSCGSAETRASPARCATVDADLGDLNELPAYCVLARWHAIERQLAVQRGELPASAAPSGVVFVTRPPDVGSGADFDSFRPGADLLLASATQAASGALELGGTRSLLAGCGLTGSVDVRGPAVSWDAKQIAFAARTAADQPLHIFQVQSDGSQCAQLSALNAATPEQDGILIHDFDPAYAPDGRLVFASTRGNISGDADHRGPTRTPAALAPNANLYVFENGGEVRQLTFLSNQEFAPSFMSDGRVIFSVEKRAQDFHQFAARRQNLDGSDYHPLIAQRPSIGFASATEVIELADRNFAVVAAGIDAADGGGAIVIVNRSIGPDQDDRDPADRAYIHSITMPTPGAFGGDAGVFRSPAALPSGRILAACDLTAGDAAAGPHHYGLCELDPTPSSTPRMLWRDPAKVAVEPAPIWAREPRTVFEARPDEANGNTRIDTNQSDAVVHFSDVPLLSTLLFSNTRVGRPILPTIRGVEVFEARPPPSGARSFAEAGHVISDRFGDFYQELRSLGQAELAPDGALKLRLPSGTPLSLALLGEDGKPLMFAPKAVFSGPMRQREEMQFYPGERAMQSFPRALFNGLCAGCHGSITGRELDAVVNVDILSSASKTLADDDPIDLR